MGGAIFRQLSFRSTQVDSVTEEESFLYSLSGYYSLGFRFFWMRHN